ncbi:MAG: signal peptidase I [Clostridia bacterium]|nr:signal peptidase I [Clostridia bacterium]
MKKRSNKKRFASTVVTSLLIISTLLCFFIVFKVAISKDTSIFGYRLFYITTGSMEPTLPVGSAILVHKAPESYEIGDIITFFSKDETIYDRPNTHRIVGIQSESGQIFYTTRGDANASPDMEPVLGEDVIGRVVWQTGTIPLAGNLLAFLATKFGFVLIILLPLLLITVGCIKDFTREYKKELRRIAEEMNQAEREEKSDKR